MNYRAIDYVSPSYTLGNVTISLSRVEIFAVALTGFLILHLLLSKTNVGRAIRAVSENKQAARLMGISVSRMYLYAFSLSAVLGSVGGSMLATLFPFNPLTGRPFLLKAFSIIVLGGMGSIIGCLVGGIIVGVAETAIGFYVGMTWKDLGAFVMLFAILMVKPKGIFGKR
jgi:branched-chain amino acid transport system permease protein